MPTFEIIGTTVRDGTPVDEIVYDVPGHGTCSGYFLRGRPGVASRLVVALHGERGDRSSLLPDLEALASKGLAGLAIDSPTTRTAIRDRDHLTAFRAELEIARAGVSAVSSSPDIDDDHIAVIGRGMGGEVAGALSTELPACRVVIAAGSLPHRGRFLESDHAIALGVQLRVGDAVAEQAAAFAPFELAHSMEASEATWLIQLAADDDRLSDEDRRELAFEIPGAIRLSEHDTWADLGRAGARQERVELVDRLT